MEAGDNARLLGYDGDWSSRVEPLGARQHPDRYKVLSKGGVMVANGDRLGHGDILRCADTGEHLFLVERKDREYGDGKMEPSWDIIVLLINKTFWEWEFVLEDEVIYERVA